MFTTGGDEKLLRNFYVFLLRQGLETFGKQKTPPKATPRFELGNGGFADLCLTAWLRRHWWLSLLAGQTRHWAPWYKMIT